MPTARTMTTALAATALLAWGSMAQAQVPQYGPNISHDQARRALVAGAAEARKLNIPMAIAIVDTAGQLVAFERMDNTQTASIAIAQDKAISAAMYRRPTKAFQDGLAQGGANLRFLALRGASPVEGGIPLVVDGKIVGAIGVSGGSTDEDGSAAKAGVDALGSR